jgi:DnaJ domain
MPGGVISEALSFAPGSAPSVALLAALPLLFVCYVRYLIGVSKLRPDLSLRKLESIELQRTVLLYEKATKRIKDVCRERRQEGITWRAWDRGRDNLRQQFREELEDLESYARDLRLTIIRLRGRPFKRYRSWAHLVSAQFALGRSLGCYSLILALLLAAFCYFEPILWAPGIGASFKTFVLWQAVKGRMLFANWMAANFVAISMPLLYIVRRATLYREHRRQVLNLKAFAATDPDRLIHDRQDNEEAVEERPEGSREVVEDCDWFSVLDVLPSATIEEVKQAYKVLVKKNHPDRVQDMSPSFVKLAEAETKKLNAAYEEALIYFRHG